MNGDDYTAGEGDVMPAAWWPVADHIPLAVRYRRSHIPGLPHLAFADEFTASLTVYGPRYLDLSHFTRWNARQPVASPQRRAFHTLTAAFRDVFTTVIGVHGPDAVWLALRLTQLSDPIADALLAVRACTLTALDRRPGGSS